MHLEFEFDLGFELRTAVLWFVVSLVVYHVLTRQHLSFCSVVLS